MAVAIPLVAGIGGQWLGGTLLGGIIGTGAGSAIGGMMGSYMGSLLFPQQNPSMSLPKVGSFPTQTTLSGSAIPMIRGTARVAGNVIYVSEARPFTVTHKSGGGGKGGSPSISTEETRYKRDILIGIAEGPAAVTRMWKGKELGDLTDCTIFAGDGNSGLATVTGLEFGHYKRLNCAWFEDYDIGNTENIPLFTFEVACDTTVRTCQIIAGGTTKVIGGDTSSAEAYDIEGNYESVNVLINTGAVSSILRNSTNGYYYFNDASNAHVHCRHANGTNIWDHVIGYPGLSTSMFMDTSGYLYVGYTKNAGGTQPLLEKLNPDTGNAEWQGFNAAGFGATLSGVGDGYLTYNYSTTSQLYSFDKSDGSTVLLKSLLVMDGIPVAGGVVPGPTTLIYVTGKAGYGSADARVWIPNNPGGEKWMQFDNATAVKRIVVTTGSGDYLNYIYAAINTTGGSHYVIKIGVSSIGHDLTNLGTFDVGNTIYDIVEDIDGGLLVCHDLGTDEEGNSGHITKLDDDVEHKGTLTLDNDRTGFVGTLARGPGTVILSSASVITLNPLDITLDVMTDEVVGGGINNSLFNMTKWAESRQVCVDNDITMALALDRQQPLLDWLDFIQSHYFGYLRLG